VFLSVSILFPYFFGLFSKKRKNEDAGLVKDDLLVALWFTLFYIACSFIVCLLLGSIWLTVGVGFGYV